MSAHDRPRPVAHSAQGWSAALPTSGWHRRPSRRARWLLAACLAMLLAVALAAGAMRPWLRAMLPLYAAATDGFSPSFRVERFELIRLGKDEVYQASFVAAKPLLADGIPVLKPGMNARSTVSTSAAKVLQPIGCLLALVVLWPLASWRELVLRMALLIVVVPISLVLDLPVVLIGELWDSVHDAFPSVNVSLPWALATFLDHGGRLGIGIAAGLLVIDRARWIEDGWG